MVGCGVDSETAGHLRPRGRLQHKACHREGETTGTVVGLRGQMLGGNRGKSRIPPGPGQTSYLVATP